jgi:hypothetical protein
MATGLRNVGKLEAWGGIIQRGFMKVRTIEVMGIRGLAVMIENIMGPAYPLWHRSKGQRPGGQAGRSAIPTTVSRMGINPSKMERHNARPPCLPRLGKEPVTHFLRLHTARSITRILTFLVIPEAAVDVTSPSSTTISNLSIRNKPADTLTRTTLESGDTKQARTSSLELGRGIPHSIATNRIGATTTDDLERSIEIAIATRDYVLRIGGTSGRTLRGAPGAEAPRAEVAGVRVVSERWTDEKNGPGIATATTSGKKRRRRKFRGTWKAANCQESVPSA